VASLAVPAVHAGGLTDLLVQKVGVTAPQANGGAGSIFQLAKSRLTQQAFGRLSKAVPGMDSYLAAAPAFTLPGAVAATAAATPATPPAASDGTSKAKAALDAAKASLAGTGATATTGDGMTKAKAALEAAKASLAGTTATTTATTAAATTAAAATAATPPVSASDAIAAKAGQLLQGTAFGDKVGTGWQSAKLLAPAFEKLGMKPETAARFVPVIVDYVKSTGGKSSARLLTGALGL